MVASSIGYAIFWGAMLLLPTLFSRFAVALIWYASIQAIHLSWMTSTHYMGSLILLVYAGLLFALGVQFAVFSCLIAKVFRNSWGKACVMQSLALAGVWVWMEWIRLYFLTGFTWNPAGLALASSSLSIQWASVFGIYGLSFWVVWTNLSALRAWFLDRSYKTVGIWAALTLFPYGFGLVYQPWVERSLNREEKIQAALIETGLSVEQKHFCYSNPEAFIPVLDQWERVWKELKDHPLNLIILPETAFPYGFDRPIATLEEVSLRWKEHYGKEAEQDFPPLRFPWAIPCRAAGKTHWKISNGFLAQSLANHYQAQVILGLDIKESKRQYNAALQFSPGNQMPARYDKRILAPIGEYVPLQDVQWIAEFIGKEFGIFESFSAGDHPRIFSSPIPIGVAICLEELYSDTVRDLRRKGAKLLVGLSNDVWFPKSKLPDQHFDHGRIRAVENGVFLLRSTNCGLTGGVDCFGRPIGLGGKGESGVEVHLLSVPLFSFPTLYSFWGDFAILLTSSFFAAAYLAWAAYLAAVKKVAR